MKGTVIRFHRTRGFGFIKPKKGGKKVLVHYADIVTDDKWPFIKRGTEVEFELVEKDDNGKRKAKKVTLVGGDKIPIHIPNNPDRIANDDDIYTGTIKFFERRKGWGMIIPDGKITWQELTATDAVFFARDAIDATGAAKGMVLSLRPGTKVTFKVYKDKKKRLGAHNLQNEEGKPLEYEVRKGRSRGGRKRRRRSGKGRDRKRAKVVKKTKEELLEERVIDEEQNLYTGTVKFYSTGKEYGFISIEDEITFNGATAKDAIYVLKEDIVCRSEEVGLNEGKKVIFKVYKDSKGIGACEVQNEDGTPIVYEPEEDAQSEEQEAEEEVKEPTPEPVVKPRRSSRKSKSK